MLTRRHLVVSMLALSAAGCAAPREPVFALQSSVETKRDQKSEGIMVLGIVLRHDPPYANLFENKYQIISWVFDDDPIRFHRLVVDHIYHGNEIAWNAATDGDDAPLLFTPVLRKTLGCTQGCTFHEVFGAVIEDGVLGGALNQGFPVRFNSRRGRTMTIQVTPAQIQAQLDAYDRLWAQRWGQVTSQDGQRRRDRSRAPSHR